LKLENYGAFESSQRHYKKLKRKAIMQIQFAICLPMDGNAIANGNFQI